MKYFVEIQYPNFYHFFSVSIFNIQLVKKKNIVVLTARSKKKKKIKVMEVSATAILKFHKWMNTDWTNEFTSQTSTIIRDSLWFCSQMDMST